ncbi:putative bifunctional diguanylate cyclase/phosphodiesterase [Chelativorans salis]|uniref:EAL domain-containing protein n=1 Tax=Chelativorans salis TaxID=2978478 RepID=A0ABT2LU17_9HYPH|nr:GGDEF domain-containing phosphodiesterase [Chelativorans sp. EGI FJ00035]MCT7378021.1 EAL domain-containing protein [Chelativorans sp. EGI FJ00035]
MDEWATQELTDPLDKRARQQWESLPTGELRALYREQDESRRRTTARHGLWLGVVVYLLYSITDILLIPDVAIHTIAARITVAAAVLILIEALVHTKASPDSLDLACAAALLAGFLGWLGPAMMTERVESLSYYMVFGTIFMMGANLFFSLRFVLSVVTSGAILVGSLLALTLFPVDASYQIALGTFYISCFIFTSFVNWKLNQERYNVFLNAVEAKLQHEEATERGEALLRLSRTDPLTGLDNRRAIEEKLRHRWFEWRAFGRGFAAILIDVDFFKKFNDHYGHQEGDRCLSVVAQALGQTAARYNASIGRYGGEEFIVLAGIDEQNQVAHLAEEIRRTVETLALPHEKRPDRPFVTASVGASFTRSGDGTKLEKIIHEADRALYLAKGNGRNCVRLFDPDDPESDEEGEDIATLLKIAIEQNLISLVYQPIQDLATGRIEAVEALMRLRTIDGKSIAPRQFIPVAERTGAIAELGEWALRTACRELLEELQVPTISVNVSPIQLNLPGFAASVAAILDETGVSGSRLTFEITEGVEMTIRDDVIDCVSELKRLGIRFWLDDFGTGFAGLSWLRLIDFDTVKIDQSFLHDARGEAMLQDIAGLVRNRGSKVLVEGVENRDQLALLRSLGIDLAQGFHLGRPDSALRSRPNLTIWEDAQPILRIV